MALADAVLFSLAKRLYRTEIAHTSEMKDSLTDIDRYDEFRANEAWKMVQALWRYGMSVNGKVVVDFGCNDGALSPEYLKAGAAKVIGVDIDAAAIERARLLRHGIEFIHGTTTSTGLADATADLIVSFDVFEHVEHPEPILKDLHRSLKVGGQLVIQTIGWHMPFAPHLWTTLPVPWAQVFFSERAMLATCRKVYAASWYKPVMHDFDAAGNRIPEKYRGDVIPTSYLNKYRVRDFERVFRQTGFHCKTTIVPLHGLAALRPLTKVPILREMVGSSVWFLLTKL